LLQTTNATSRAGKDLNWESISLLAIGKVPKVILVRQSEVGMAGRPTENLVIRREGR
jgi:hypothetical protein